RCFRLSEPNCRAESPAAGANRIWRSALTEAHMMYFAAVVALVGMNALTVSSSAARSDGYPILDVAPLCRGLTSSSSLLEGLDAGTFEQCMKGQQDDREDMIKQWSTFSSGDKTHCI